MEDTWRVVRRKPGFTLIELLVVIAIIGILSAIAFTQFNGAREKARNVARLAGMRQIQTALELYYDTHQRYPGASCGSTVYGASPTNPTGGDISWTEFSRVLGNPIPNDPLITSNFDKYHWHYVVSGAADNWQHYVLEARLEGTDAPSFLSLPNAITRPVKNEPGVFRYSSDSPSPQGTWACNPTGDDNVYRGGGGPSSIRCGVVTMNNGQPTQYDAPFLCLGKVVTSGCGGGYSNCMRTP